MVIKCPKGYYHLKHNFRDAFNEEQFIEKYLEECFDKDSYIVGDISAGILRLKGFDNDPKSKNYFGTIDDYLNNSCVIGSPYFILRRINENEYEELLKNKKEETETDGFIINPLVKENFDKESLSLNSTPKDKAEIIIDMEKINSLPKGNLPDYLKEDNNSNSSAKQQKDTPVQTQTYVSSSNGFDPSKVQNRNQFNHNNDNKFNQNKKKKNHNKNRG